MNKYKVKDRAELKKMVHRGLDVTNIDVSNITDMSYMFSDAYNFNQDISGWDVSNVTDMSTMFFCANAFNQDISGWDISNVETMSSMFYCAHSFNQDISNWDVSNVGDMRNMFLFAINFNQPNLDKWLVRYKHCNEDMFHGTPMHERVKELYATQRAIDEL